MRPRSVDDGPLAPPSPHRHPLQIRTPFIPATRVALLSLVPHRQLYTTSISPFHSSPLSTLLSLDYVLAPCLHCPPSCRQILHSSPHTPASPPARSQSLPSRAPSACPQPLPPKLCVRVVSHLVGGVARPIWRACGGLPVPQARPDRIMCLTRP